MRWCVADCLISSANLVLDHFSQFRANSQIKIGVNWLNFFWLAKITWFAVIWKKIVNRLTVRQPYLKLHSLFYAMHLDHD